MQLDVFPPFAPPQVVIQTEAPGLAPEEVESVVSANAKGRDLRSVVNDIQAKVKQNVQMPFGYFIQYGGQFEAEQRASQNILVFSAIAFIVITVLSL